MVLEKMGIKSLYLERVNGLIKTDILTSKVLSDGLKKIVKLEGLDEKKEPFEKTKKITNEPIYTPMPSLKAIIMVRSS